MILIAYTMSCPVHIIVLSSNNKLLNNRQLAKLTHCLSFVLHSSGTDNCFTVTQVEICHDLHIPYKVLMTHA